LAFVLATAGCGSGGGGDAGVKADLSLDPSPPVVGENKVSLKLADADGKSLAGATVKLEGNMNHAGMKPSFADLKETSPGTYAGTLDFTMGGDWFVLVTGQTADGKRIEHKIDVKGVQAK
jgi:hypothetical protein